MVVYLLHVDELVQHDRALSVVLKMGESVVAIGYHSGSLLQSASLIYHRRTDKRMYCTLFCTLEWCEDIRRSEHGCHYAPVLTIGKSSAGL